MGNPFNRQDDNFKDYNHPNNPNFGADHFPNSGIPRDQNNYADSGNVPPRNEHYPPNAPPNFYNESAGDKVGKVLGFLLKLPFQGAGLLLNLAGSITISIYTGIVGYFEMRGWGPVEANFAAISSFSFGGYLVLSIAGAFLVSPNSVLAFLLLKTGNIAGWGTLFFLLTTAIIYFVRNQGIPFIIELLSTGFESFVKWWDKREQEVRSERVVKNEPEQPAETYDTYHRNVTTPPILPQNAQAAEQARKQQAAELRRQIREHTRYE